jgi:hypothetical protein
MMHGVKNMHESAKKFGKVFDTVPTWKDRMEKVGFVNVREDVYKVCIYTLFPKAQSKY